MNRYLVLCIITILMLGMVVAAGNGQGKDKDKKNKTNNSDNGLDDVGKGNGKGKDKGQGPGDGNVESAIENAEQQISALEKNIECGLIASPITVSRDVSEYTSMTEFTPEQLLRLLNAILQSAREGQLSDGTNLTNNERKDAANLAKDIAEDLNVNEGRSQGYWKNHDECPPEAPECTDVGEIDFLNIGDERSEAGHSLRGWSEANLPGGFGGRDDGTFRQVIDPLCGEDKREASFRVDANGYYATKLGLRALDGMSNSDSFEVYVNGDLVGVYTDTQDSAEVWNTVEFDLDYLTGELLVVISATDSIWSGCDTYGQVAFSWASIEGVECREAPEDNETDDDNSKGKKEKKNKGQLIAAAQQARRDQFALLKDDLKELGYKGGMGDFTTAFNEQVKEMKDVIQEKVETNTSENLTAAIVKETVERDLAAIRERIVASIDVEDEEVAEEMGDLVGEEEDVSTDEIEDEIGVMDEDFKDSLYYIATNGTEEQKRELKMQTIQYFKTVKANERSRLTERVDTGDLDTDGLREMLEEGSSLGNIISYLESS